MFGVGVCFALGWVWFVFGFRLGILVLFIVSLDFAIVDCWDNVAVSLGGWFVLLVEFF